MEVGRITVNVSTTIGDETLRQSTGDGYATERAPGSH